MTALLPYRGAGYDGWEMAPPILGINGGTSTDIRNAVDAWIAASTVAPEWALLNISVNGSGTEATFKSDLAYIADAIHTAWPDCKQRYAYPWKRGSDAAMDNMATWIDFVLAARSGWTTPPAAGHDERVWLKGSDNGATMTVDGVHYSAAGNTEAVNQWLTVMGF